MVSSTVRNFRPSGRPPKRSSGSVLGSDLSNSRRRRFRHSSDLSDDDMPPLEPADLIDYLDGSVLDAARAVAESPLSASNDDRLSLARVTLGQGTDASVVFPDGEDIEIMGFIARNRPISHYGNQDGYEANGPNDPLAPRNISNLKFHVHVGVPVEVAEKYPDLLAMHDNSMHSLATLNRRVIEQYGTLTNLELNNIERHTWIDPRNESFIISSPKIFGNVEALHPKDADFDVSNKTATPRLTTARKFADIPRDDKGRFIMTMMEYPDPRKVFWAYGAKRSSLPVRNFDAYDFEGQAVDTVAFPYIFQPLVAVRATVKPRMFSFDGKVFSVLQIVNIDALTPTPFSAFLVADPMSSAHERTSLRSRHLDLLMMPPPAQSSTAIVTNASNVERQRRGPNHPVPAGPPPHELHILGVARANSDVRALDNAQLFLALNPRPPNGEIPTTLDFRAASRPYKRVVNSPSPSETLPLALEPATDNDDIVMIEGAKPESSDVPI